MTADRDPAWRIEAARLRAALDAHKDRAHVEVIARELGWAATNMLLRRRHALWFMERCARWVYGQWRPSKDEGLGLPPDGWTPD